MSAGLPWWELVLRGTAVFVFLMLLVRLSGKRTIGQFTPFDLLVVVLLSESVSNALTGGDQTLAGGLIAASTLIALNLALGWITARNPAAERLIDGRPVLLARNGVIYRDELRRVRVSGADLREAMRENNCLLKDLRCAFLETDGGISIMKRSS